MILYNTLRLLSRQKYSVIDSVVDRRCINGEFFKRIALCLKAFDYSRERFNGSPLFRARVVHQYIQMLLTACVRQGMRHKFIRRNIVAVGV